MCGSLLQDGAHYMIYTPSDPLLFVVVKVLFKIYYVVCTLHLQYAIVLKFLYCQLQLLCFFWIHGGQRPKQRTTERQTRYNKLQLLCLVKLELDSMIWKENLSNLDLFVQDNDGLLQIADDVSNVLIYS